jgi:hypothetical protein
LLAGSHHCNKSGNTYEVIPDKTEQAPDGSDKGRIVKGVYPVFKTGIKLWEIFKNKFQQVPDDTPTTHPADGYCSEAPAAPAVPQTDPEASVPESVVAELQATITTLKNEVDRLTGKAGTDLEIINELTKKVEELTKANEELVKASKKKKG